MTNKTHDALNVKNIGYTVQTVSVDNLLSKAVILRHAGWRCFTGGVTKRITLAFAGLHTNKITIKGSNLNLNILDQTPNNDVRHTKNR
jgi:hypothetical protein